MTHPLDSASLGPLVQSILVANTAGRLGDTPEIKAFVQAAAAVIPPGLRAPAADALAPALDSAKTKLAALLREDAQLREANRAIQLRGNALAKALKAELAAALGAVGSLQHSVTVVENVKDVTQHGVRVANLGGIAGVNLSFDLVFDGNTFTHWTHNGREVDIAEAVTATLRRCIFAHEDMLTARRGRHP